MLSDAITNAILKDRHLYWHPELPLITIYDDNFFVRNDYDVLSVGQRNYLINFFKPYGFKQVSGKKLASADNRLHFPTPKRILALSSFEPSYLQKPEADYYVITPSTFAEVLFYRMLDNKQDLAELKQLITTCPFNIELIRDISYNSPIEHITKQTYDELVTFQKQIVNEKFKHKKAL